jgi:hypothetical protein
MYRTRVPQKKLVLCGHGSMMYDVTQLLVNKFHYKRFSATGYAPDDPSYQAQGIYDNIIQIIRPPSQLQNRCRSLFLLWITEQKIA